jgi:hypothetical protein
MQSTIEPKVVLDPQHTLEIENHKWTGTIHEYRVVVPVTYAGKITDGELLTRCDNRAIDLTQDAGQRLHFGGWVKYSDPQTAMVSVCVD